MLNTSQKGQHYEDAVCSMLKRRGFKIIARNFAVHNVGELDIVAIKDDEVCIFEVKARKAYSSHSSNVFGTPEFSITRSKRQKIYKTTRYLISKYKLYDFNIRYLAVSLLFDERGLIQNVEFIPFD